MAKPKQRTQLDEYQSDSHFDRYDLIKRIAEKINETATNLFTPGELEDDERYSD